MDAYYHHLMEMAMNRLYKVLVLTLSVILSLLLSINHTRLNASGDIDRIELYEVKVDPRKDGTLDMEYHFIWRVLDDTTEGPLTWVQIGVANYYVDEFKPLTDNIKEMSYYSNDGSHIRIDFYDSYHKNDVVDFKFSFHQSRMYTLKDNKCQYKFLNGYFDEILVDKYIIRWNSANVEYTNLSNVVDGYYYYETSLYYGSRVDTEFSYSQSVFEGLSKKGEYSSRTMTNTEIVLVALFVSIFVGIILGLIVVAIIRKLSKDYMEYRGFTGRRLSIYPGYNRINSFVGVNSKGTRIINPLTSSSSSFGGGGSGGCACACACACAGGGRAGCTRKDFYHTNITIYEMKKHL